MIILKDRRLSTSFIGGLLRACSIFLAVGVLLTCLSGCKSSKYNYLDVAFENQVPFAADYDQWNELELIERDEYGRELFYCATLNDPAPSALSDFTTDFGAQVNFFFICIPQSENESLCHNQLSYLLVPSRESVSTEELETFKEQNEWGKEVSEDESIIRIRMVNYAKVYSTTKITELIEKQVETDASYFHIDRLYEENDRPIFVFREFFESGDKCQFGKTYLFYLSNEEKIEELTELTGAPDEWNLQILGFYQQHCNNS